MAVFLWLVRNHTLASPPRNVKKCIDRNFFAVCPSKILQYVCRTSDTLTNFVEWCINIL